MPAHFIKPNKNIIIVEKKPENVRFFYLKPVRLVSDLKIKTPFGE
jgi:hypothetical protein